MASWKHTDEVKIGERVVVGGQWREVVDYKPGGIRYLPGTVQREETWILIVDDGGSLREIRYRARESISVKPPLRA